MIDIVAVSPYVIATRVKRGVELSTDYLLMMSWIRRAWRMPDRPGRPK